MLASGMSDKKLLVTALFTPTYFILLGVLIAFPIEREIHLIDIFFWSVLVFLSIAAQSETVDMTISQIDAVTVAMMFIFPPWMAAALVLIFTINPRVFRPRRSYGWHTEIINHLIYGISAAGTGVTYSIIHDLFTFQPASLGGLFVALLLMLNFYGFNLATVMAAFYIRKNTPPLTLLRNNEYGFPLLNFLIAPLALLVAIVYQNPIFSEWGGWSVIFFMGPIFYAQYIIAARTYQLRLTNQKMIDNEASHQAMIESLPVGVYRTTEDGRFINANTQLIKMLGFKSHDELTRINAGNFYLTPEERPQEIERRKDRNGTFSNEVKFKRRNGEIFWVRDTSTISIDKHGYITHIDGVLEDITERKSIEARLDNTHQLVLQAKQEWEATVDSLPQFICLLDHNKCIIRSNRTLERWGLGTVDGIKGQTICEVLKEFNPTDGDDLPTLINTNWERLISGESFSFEIRKEDNQQYATVQIQPVAQTTHHNAVGRNSYAVAVVSDNTANKQLEQALRQINLDLEARVHDRTAELEAVNLLLQREINERELIAIELEDALQQEKELNAFKSRFGTMISHEFRTPLAVIQTSADLLERYADRLSLERRVEFTHRIRQQIKHLVNLLDDILTVSRAQTVGVEMTRDWIKLHPFMSEIKKELYQLIRAERELICDVTLNGCDRAYIDQRLIHQLITNLISNAMKYSDDGSTITFSTYCEASNLIIEVEDEGIGIPLEAQHHLFDVFYRADNVGDISGTGVGLAIVKLAAELHKGNITFKSTPDVGTRFTVTIPIGEGV